MKVDGIYIEIEVVDSLGGSPARCTIIEPWKRAKVRVARDHFQNFNKATKTFVILHELGHAVLNTGDEIAVDRWAFRQYSKTDLPLDGAVFALSRVLDPLNNDEHADRVRRQFYRAKHAAFIKGKFNWKKFKQIKN